MCLVCFVKENRKIYTEETANDWCECTICGFRGAELSLHIKNDHPEVADTYSGPKKAKSICDRVSGAGNPGYQHGGNLSPFSKKFVGGYDAEWHANHNKLQSERMKDSGAFARSSYGSDEEYSKAQTRDLEYFVTKYGEDEGAAKHKAKTEKWIKTMNSKSEEELNLINSKKVRKSTCFYSKAEQELFGKLKEVYPELSDQLGLSNSEHRYVFDMVLGKKIIEYNGDFWHANPNKYDETFVNPYNNLSYSQIHERDSNKLQVAKDNGYVVFIVWEESYMRNPTKVIDECLAFLTQ